MRPFPRTSIISRRKFVAAGAALTLTACTPGPSLTNAFSAARRSLVGAPDAPVTKEYIATLPYASIGARIGRGQRSMLVLGRYDGPDRHWISADRAVVVTRNGRLIRTFGIGPDMRDTRDLAADPIANGIYDFGRPARRVVDAGTPLKFGIPVDSTFEVVGRRDITIMDTPHDTLLVREFNRAPTLRWVFENEFWLDFATGYAWKSVQHFSQDVPPIEIEVYKRDL